MNYERLNQLCVNERTYSALRLSTIIWFLVFTPILLFLFTYFDWVNYINSYLAGVVVITSPIIIGLIILFISISLEEKTSNKVKNHFNSLLNNAICKFESGEYEIIEVNSELFKIAFRSKTTDCKDLKSFLNKEIKTMNKIMGTKIQVDVI